MKCLWVGCTLLETAHLRTCRFWSYSPSSDNNRTKRQSFTVYYILQENVGGSIECRSCGQENRDAAWGGVTDPTDQRRACCPCQESCTEIKTRFLRVLMCRSHFWRAPDTPTIGRSCVCPRCARAGEPHRKGAWKCSAARQAEKSWGSPFCRQVLFSVFLTFLTCNQNPSWS